jgi:transglutaminase-like putative cysteine protease
LVSGLTISLWYFVFFLIYLGLASAWLMAAAGATSRQGRSWLPAWSALLAASLVLSAFFFMVTPRSQGYRRFNPFLAAGMDKLASRGQAVTGFTEEVSLGYFGELQRSSARFMRIVPPPGGQGARPPELHIRGAAFDAFDGRRWTRSPEPFRYLRDGRLIPSAAGLGWLTLQDRRLLFPAAPGAPAAPVYDFMIYPIALSVLFTVGSPASAEGINLAASFDADDSIHLSAPYLRGLRYQLRLSPAPPGLALPAAGREKEFAALFLQLPPGLSPRFFALAQRLAAGAPDAAAKARAVEGYLRRNYRYSTFSDSGRRDVEDFLFSAKRGNCEYFATAGVLLLRAAGVPARLATGFLAQDWNEYGGFYDVRQSAAHAWLEASLPGRGWIAFDPTPAAGFSASAQALRQRLARLFDAAQAEWYRRVIGYDQYTQRDAFRRLSLGFSPEALLDRAGRALRPLLALAAALGLILVLSRLRRLWSRGPQADYARAAAALARAGLARLPFQTPREHARDVIAKRPELAPLQSLVELHYLERYGPGLAAREKSESRRLLLELRRRL